MCVFKVRIAVRLQKTQERCSGGTLVLDLINNGKIFYKKSLEFVKSKTYKQSETDNKNLLKAIGHVSLNIEIIISESCLRPTR